MGLKILPSRKYVDDQF